MPSVDESVKLNLRIGFGNKEIISLLAHEHSVSCQYQGCEEVVTLHTERYAPTME